MTGKQSENYTTERINVRVIGVRKWFWSKLFFLHFYFKSILPTIQLKADIYFASDLYSLPIAYLAAKSNHSKLIYDSRELYSSIAALKHRRFEQRVWRTIEKFLIKRANATVTVNESIAQILSREYTIPKPVVLLNCPRYQEIKQSNKLREVCHIAEGKRILLYQGGLQQGRGIFTLLEVIQRLPDCVLLFLGDGALKEELRMKSEKLKERVYIIDAVPVEQLLLYTASADAGLCLIENYGSSYYLSLPNKFFEYVMAGVPILASNFPEMKRIIDEYKVGETANPEDVNDIAEKIQRLLSPGHHQHLVENCRAAAKIYNWDIESKKLIATIDNLEILQSSIP